MKLPRWAGAWLAGSRPGTCGPQERELLLWNHIAGDSQGAQGWEAERTWGCAHQTLGERGWGLHPSSYDRLSSSAVTRGGGYSEGLRPAQ